MPDLPRQPGIKADPEAESDGELVASTSRWQIVVGIIGLLVLVVLGIQIFGLAAGDGGHGPGDDTAPAEVNDVDSSPEDDGHTPPGGFDH
jgi:hypothetical protein